MRGAILPRIVDPDIVAGLAVLAQADAHAFGVADDVVLDDPALAPVGADESDLLGGRGRPLGSGLAHVKTAHRNIVTARLVRVEATVAHVDLHQFPVRVLVVEVGVDVGILVVAFGEPSPWGTLAIPEVGRRLRIQHTLQEVRLPQGFAVEIDLASVVRPSLVREPIPGNRVFVGIVAAKEGCRQRRLPHAGHEWLPVADRLRPLDHGLLAGSRLVDDPLRVGLASARRCHAFAVGPLMHGDRSEEHTSELQSPCNLVCRLLLEKKTGDVLRWPIAAACLTPPPPNFEATVEEYAVRARPFLIDLFFFNDTATTEIYTLSLHDVFRS